MENDKHARERSVPTSRLVSIAYPDQGRAVEVIEALRHLDTDEMIELEDVEAVTRDSKGGIKPERLVTHAAAGAAGGTVAGKLVGVIRSDDASEYGFGQFGQQISAVMVPGSSAVLMLVHKKDPGAAIATLQQFGGRVIQTTLPDNIEAQLRSALTQLAT